MSFAELMKRRVSSVISSDNSIVSNEYLNIIEKEIDRVLCDYMEISGGPKVEIVCKNNTSIITVSAKIEKFKQIY